MKVLGAQLRLTPRDPTDCVPPGPSAPGKSTGVGSLSLLQGNFPTQGLSLNLLHRRRILYCLSHQGSPNYTSGQRTNI